MNDSLRQTPAASAVSLVPLDQAARQPGHAVHYREVIPATRSTPQPPAFIFGAMPAHLAPGLFAEYAQGAVGCYSVENGRVTSDGVVLRDGEAFWSLALNHPDYLVARLVDPAGVNRAALPVRRLAGQLTILHGPGYNVFGHWLVDVLPRLFVLHRAGYDIARLRYLIPSDTPRFGLQFLRLVGIADSQIIRHDHNAELVQADDVLLPTILRLKSRLSPCFLDATSFWRGLFRAGAQITPPQPEGRRIFVSREHAADQRLLKNREEIEAMASQAGYAVVHPERLSLPDQIELFSQSTHIAGEYGSGLHNTVFAPPGARICALRGTSHTPGFVQSSLAEACGHHIGYVFAPTPEHARNQMITIEPSLFARALEALDAPPREAWSVAPSASRLQRHGTSAATEEAALHTSWLRKAIHMLTRKRQS